MKTFRTPLAVLLVLALLLPLCAFPASAADTRTRLALDIVYYHDHPQTVTFTPRKSGVYRISTGIPTHLRGLYVFLTSGKEPDPFVSVYADGQWIGTAEDKYGDTLKEEVLINRTTGEEVRFWRFEKVNNYADGYVYLTAGVTYRLLCGNTCNRRTAFSVRVNYVGSAEIEFIAPRKSLFSLSTGDAVHVQEDSLDYYHAKLSNDTFFFHIKLSNGKRLEGSVNALSDKIIDLKSDWQEDFGASRVTFSLLGQSFTFDYFITE